MMTSHTLRVHIRVLYLLGHTNLQSNFLLKFYKHNKSNNIKWRIHYNTLENCILISSICGPVATFIQHNVLAFPHRSYYHKQMAIIKAHSISMYYDILWAINVNAIHGCGPFYSNNLKCSSHISIKGDRNIFKKLNYKSFDPGIGFKVNGTDLQQWSLKNIMSFV
jgi:hypothetical protein